MTWAKAGERARAPSPWCTATSDGRCKLLACCSGCRKVLLGYSNSNHYKLCHNLAWTTERPYIHGLIYHPNVAQKNDIWLIWPTGDGLITSLPNKPPLTDSFKVLFCQLPGSNYPSSPPWHPNQCCHRHDTVRTLNQIQKPNGIIAARTGWMPDRQPRFQSLPGSCLLCPGSLSDASAL